MDYHAAKIRGF